MNDNINIADWANVATWFPLFLKRKKASVAIERLETEKIRVAGAPLSKQEVKEKLRTGELEEIAEGIAVACSKGDELGLLVNGKAALETWAKAVLCAEARKAVDKIGGWPSDARSQQQKTDEIAAIDKKIEELKKDLDLRKIGNKRLIVHDEQGQPISFRPEEWVRALAEEIRRKGPTHNDAGEPQYPPEKLKAIKLLTDFLP